MNPYCNTEEEMVERLERLALRNRDTMTSNEVIEMQELKRRLDIIRANREYEARR